MPPLFCRLWLVSEVELWRQLVFSLGGGGGLAAGRLCGVFLCPTFGGYLVAPNGAVFFLSPLFFLAAKRHFFFFFFFLGGCLSVVGGAGATDHLTEQAGIIPTVQNLNGQAAGRHRGAGARLPITAKMIFDGRRFRRWRGAELNNDNGNLFL